MSHGLEEIKSGAKLLALIIRHEYGGEGVNFPTQPEDPFQIGVLNHPAGHAVKAHSHNKLPKENAVNPEFLVVMSGEVEVQFFDGEQAIATAILAAGDALLQIAGGHSFKILKPTRLIEVKQGPFLGVEKEKTFIEVPK